ncbi:SigE family RNA polymerase sigma factor [Dactylosporangium sp. NPDC000244]|uniref:SigE family RNA polymerase sigma factor n=1 Tax=Dactylosporangium sp. NPDC000244 TaxID=3154365 RepID=UPI00331F8E5A
MQRIVCVIASSQVVEGIGLGRMAAFDEFVRARGSVLLRFAYVLTGDRGLAEDLVQNALVKAYLRWDGRAAIERPEAYVRQIIVNEFVSWWRRRSSREVVGPVPDRSDGDHAEGVTERARIRRVLSQLPRRQRAVLVLRYYEGLPDREIANLLGCAEGTVRSLATRAFSTLRSHPELGDEIERTTARREDRQ